MPCDASTYFISDKSTFISGEMKENTDVSFSVRLLSQLLRNLKDGHFREVTDFTELNFSLDISCLQRKLRSVDPTCETARPQTLLTLIHL